MKRTVITALGFVLACSTLSFAQQAPTTPQPRTGAAFVDANGDGICDLQQARSGQRAGKGYGPGNGTGNQGNGPKDGTGFGAAHGGGAGTGTGNCDGTGPKGMGRRGGRG